MPKHWSQQTWLIHPDKCNSYKNKYLQKAAGSWPTWTIRRQPHSMPLNPETVDRKKLPFQWHFYQALTVPACYQPRTPHLWLAYFLLQRTISGYQLYSRGLFPWVPLSKQPPALKKTQYSNCSTRPSACFATCSVLLSPHHLERWAEQLEVTFEPTASTLEVTRLSYLLVLLYYFIQNGEWKYNNFFLALYLAFLAIQLISKHISPSTEEELLWTEMYKGEEWNR